MSSERNERIRRVASVVGSWAGEDAAEIDEIYRQYYGAHEDEVEAATAAIVSGNAAREARAA